MIPIYSTTVLHDNITDIFYMRAINLLKKIIRAPTTIVISSITTTTARTIVAIIVPLPSLLFPSLPAAVWAGIMLTDSEAVWINTH